jgi:hypothetical protein
VTVGGSGTGVGSGTVTPVVAPVVKPVTKPVVVPAVVTGQASAPGAALPFTGDRTSTLVPWALALLGSGAAALRLGSRKPRPAPAHLRTR